ncbi:putative transcription factor MYB-HB-like family [Helianthus annuus]|nr:putative transcription factor MYB-HB-like family [Helianthus annuus]KAJ0856547.1 putative transcription factor MYB-HB-like family [Helianthus annuus]
MNQAMSFSSSGQSYVGAQPPWGGSQTSGNHNSSGKPPSWGAVRPLVGSETTGNQDSYGQPPSINDVPVPQASHTSSSSKRKKIYGAETQSGMSLTPSRVDVRPLVGSQTTGGTGNQDSYGKPPSFNEPNDVCGPQASQTSSLLKRNEISGAGSQSDMSLTPHDIMMVDSGEEGVVDRPSCLVWTADLHKHFVEAVQRLDTMLQVVNVEGLTLEDVSSNLQRCKLSL